jgi:tetratricopeptide (TPR) repeat protein
MRNFFIAYFISCCSHFALSQSVQLKKPLTKEEEQYIKNEVLQCFYLEPQLNCSYSTDDLKGSFSGRDKPASLKTIEELKKKLKGNDQDANTLAEIAGIYSRLKMTVDADSYSQKAIEITKRVLSQHPDSTEEYVLLGGIYMSALRFGESIQVFKKMWQLDPASTVPPSLMPVEYAMAGHLDSCLQTIKTQIRNYPEKLNSYESLPLYHLYAHFKDWQEHADDSLYTRALNPSEFIRMPVLDSFYIQHRSDPDTEFLHRVSQQIMIFFYSIMSSMELKDFDPLNVKFTVPKELESKILDNRQYFENCLKGNDKTRFYYSNKLLGTAYLLLNEPKKAIPYLKKTIELKSPDKCSIRNNSNEDYDNLLTVYSILKDSIAEEKVLLEKIRVLPLIEPNPMDYLNLSKLYVSLKKYELANKYCKQAFTMDNKNASVLIELASIEYLNNNNEKALEYINQAYSLDKERWESHLLYAAISLQKNDLKNAYTLFDTANKKSGKDWIQRNILDKFFEVTK